MAEGRILNKRIGLDKAVHDLSSDTSRLAFTWSIPHLDRDGRVSGDPATLRSLVFPRRTDISIEQMEAFIREWAEAGLVVWYEAGGDQWLEFPSFRKNQPNLRHDREAASTIPPASEGHILAEDCRRDAGATPEEVRSESGATPESVRSDAGATPAEFNGSEEKGREERAHAREEPPPVVDNSDPPAREGPQFVLAYDFGKRYFAKTSRPFVPIEEHFAAAAKLLRQLGGDQEAALEACRRYFEEAWWFTEDRRTRKPSYSFGGFCAHAAEILAANDGHRPRAAPECPVCGTPATSTAGSCLHCGLDRAHFKNPEAVAEHKRWFEERQRQREEVST